MKSDGIDQETKQKIISLLLALFPGAKIYLYGSRARGTHGETSDIDLAIDTGKIEEFYKLGEAREILEATHIPYKIDLVDLNKILPEFHEKISKEMVLWKL